MYAFYYSFFEKIYQTTPLFFNDIKSFQTAFYILWDSFGLWFFPTLIGITLILAGIFILGKYLIRFFTRIELTKISYSLAGLFIGLTLITLYTQGLKVKSNASVQFFSYSLIENIVNTIQTKKEYNTLFIEKLKSDIHLADSALPVRPNIYMIFIESYGRFCYDNELIFKSYKPALKVEAEKLDKKGFSTISGFSNSPTNGGLSWLAYASVLYGFDIDKQGTYFALLKDSLWNDYPHWTRMLKKNGYKNYRISSIATNERMTIPWELYNNFYAVDQWIRYEDMNYSGKLYGFGPSLPDQFALNFGQSVIDSIGIEPYSLFFITQNSHNPFFSPEKPVSDWRNLSNGSADLEQRSRFLDKPSLPGYAKSIIYQFRYLTEFIITHNDPDDIFILIGDHQPPLITDNNGSFETPLHIISKDAGFIEKFSSFGFQKGLIIDTTGIIPKKHSDLYNYFLKSIHMSKYSNSEDIENLNARLNE